jgi:hypothetical protein
MKNGQLTPGVGFSRFNGGLASRFIGRLTLAEPW